jgi:hypothetical protein
MWGGQCQEGATAGKRAATLRGIDVDRATHENAVGLERIFCKRALN